MTPKEYLLQYRETIELINERGSQIAELEALAAQTSSKCSGNIGSFTVRSDRIGNIVAKIVDCERKLQEDIARLSNIRLEIEETINKVPDMRLRTLLRERYICGFSWEKVAYNMDMSYVHVVHNLHPKALKIIKDLIEFNIE